MKKAKLTELLKTLTIKELEKLGSFIRSPYFCKDEHIAKLYDFLAPHYPDFVIDKIDHPLAFKAVYGANKAYSQTKIVNLMSDMNLVTVKFIQHLEYEYDNIGQQKYLSTAYANRKKFKEFERTLDKLKVTLTTMPYRDLDYYYEIFEIEKNKYMQITSKKVLSTRESLIQMKDCIDAIELLGKIKINLEMYSRAILLGEDFHNNDSIGELFFAIEKSHIKDNLILNLYSTILKMIEYKDERYFLDIKKLFFENTNRISRVNRQDILGYLVNFTIGQWNIGVTKFAKDSFEILKYGFEEELFGDLTNIESLFINTTYFGSTQKEYEWLQFFLSKFSYLIELKNRDSIVLICKAIIAFDNHDYTSVRNILSSHSFPNPVNRVRAKSLLVKAIYEDYATDETEYRVLIYQISNFNKFLKRNRKISSKRIIPYVNFLKILNLLTKFRYNINKPDSYIKKIKFEFSNMETIYNKSWLNEKINLISTN